jgi:hypothetical protein
VDADLLVTCPDVQVAASQDVIVDPEEGLHVRPQI